MINISNLTSKKSEKKYVFSDLDLNFEESKVTQNRRENDYAPGNDLVVSTDEEAIKNSIRNLLFQNRYLEDLSSTLKSYIGEPISEFRGIAIGEDIRQILGIYEPRITVEKIVVYADIDNSLYRIFIFAKFKNLGTTLRLDASFSKNGSFNFINN